MTGEPEDGLSGLWVTISELARMRGLDKSVVSRRVGRLEARGALNSRQGKGGTKLVNLAQYDHACEQNNDAVRALNGAASAARGAPAAPADADAAGDPVLSRQQARRASYDADLKQLDLEERLNKLLPIDRVEAAMTRCAEAMVRAIGQLSPRAEELAAAVAKDGVNGGRALLKAFERELRARMGEELRIIAEKPDEEERGGGAQGFDA